MSAEKIAHLRLEDEFEGVPVSVSAWEDYLDRNRIKRIFCTTSSKHLDQSNGNLVTAARKRPIMALGVLDHWIGIDRFFTEDVPAYLPDYLFCIDETVRQRLTEAAGKAGVYYAIGHPNLEILMMNRQGIVDRKKYRILIVSQPDSLSGSFNSIFSKKSGSRRLIDEIAAQVHAAFDNRSDRYRILFRPHPKEKPGGLLPENVGMDEYASWEESMAQNDIFIGLHSMGMLEAAFSGKVCISLRVKELEPFFQESIPINYAECINNIESLVSVLRSCCRSDFNGYQLDSRAFNGSTQRAVKILETFFAGRPMPQGQLKAEGRPNLIIGT